MSKLRSLKCRTVVSASTVIDTPWLDILQKDSHAYTKPLIHDTNPDQLIIWLYFAVSISRRGIAPAGSKHHR